MMRRIVLAAAVALVLPGQGTAAPPPDLEVILEIETPSPPPASPTFAETTRRTAIRAAAIAYGSRAGLARRGWEIAALLERFGPQLETVFRFRDLLLHQHGFLLLPPVMAQTDHAFRLAAGGHKAAAAARIVRILEPARIVSAPPGWRDFVVRTWQPAQLPAAALLPRGIAETRLWKRWIIEGWSHGTRLADDIFAADLDRLARDYHGMILWRIALKARMVSAPSLSAVTTTVAGAPTAIRIDETVGTLDTPARLNLKSGEWRPLPEMTQ